MNRAVLLIALSTTIWISGCVKKHPPTAAAPPSATASLNAPLCPNLNMLWTHIYHPDRLQVIERCKSVTGKIANTITEPDGDWHVRLTLDPGQQSLLNAKNKSDQHGDLVVEPICQAKVTQEDAKEACKDFAPNIAKLKKGTHVRVWGSYVLDQQHGWNEIHPVTAVEVIP